MANEMRLIDANDIPYEEHYVPDGSTQWQYKKELCVLKPTIDALPTVDAVVLPCKVGDKLYTFCTKGIDDYFIRESVVSKIEISEDFGMQITERRKDTSGAYFYFKIDIDQIDKSIFLTEKEALAKMDGGN